MRAIIFIAQMTNSFPDVCVSAATWDTNLSGKHNAKSNVRTHSLKAHLSSFRLFELAMRNEKEMIDRGAR
jgi:hypothetical protein